MEKEKADKLIVKFSSKVYGFAVKNHIRMMKQKAFGRDAEGALSFYTARRRYCES